MNEQPDPNAAPLPRPNGGEFRRPGNSPTNGEAQTKHETNGHSSSGLDGWTFADILARHWHWLAIGMIASGGAFFELGGSFLKPKFTAVAQLLRYETPATGDALRTPPLSPETFAGLITSPDLLRRVGDKMNPPIPPERLVKQMKIDSQPDSDLVKVFVAAPDPGQAVYLANLYTEEAVAFTKELQSRQAGEVANNYLKKQVAQMDVDITALQDQFRGMPISGAVTGKLAQVSGDLTALNRNLGAPGRPSPMALRLSEKLQTSLAELSDLTLKYTEANPLIEQKRSQIDILKGQVAEAYTNADAGGALAAVFNATPGRASDPNIELIQGKLRSLEDARVQLANRQREAELYASNPPGVVRVLAPATPKTVQSNHRRLKIGAFSIFGGFLGLGASLALVLLVEVFDNRLKTADDVKRVTRLPVLGTLGDLNRMKDEARAQWAFRTWTMLQGRLSPSQNHGLVCGVTSSIEGEGRSTWIGLMAEAASLSGFRVLTIATKPSHAECANQLTEETLENPSSMNGATENHHAMTVAANVLASPAQVTEQLTDPNSGPVVHIPLPGWVWNLDRRKQWREALRQWREIDNLVIFVELPPASVPEAVLLGSNLPNLLWLTESGAADAGETRTQLETLRHARCNLVGAVLNREQFRPVKRRFPRWVTCLALCVALSGSLRAQETNSTALPEVPAASALLSDINTSTNLSFSVVNPVERSPWQQRLTLGPGDVLTFGLYGEPTLTRTEMFVGPDGRVSYLEAQDILATGLTVDELRGKFDEEMGKYRRSPRTIITPIAYRSKKYFMLGKVVQRGVYTLDRPTTVIEALARAHGIENGLVENNTVDLADFSRSFLMRGGKRITLDFEKLLLRGDLSQNLQIEPDDYLFFPSANIRQVYVLGEVSLPGLVTYRSDLTAIAAITSRGGFNTKAYKSKVLVIRGSLNQPQTFIVNTMDIMNGRALDFKLEPKDIVYVTWRPFYKVEDLLDMATTAFIQALVTSWTGPGALDIRFR